MAHRGASVYASRRGFGVDGLAQPRHVADGVQPPLMRVTGDRSGVALQGGDMVDSNDPVEVDVSVSTHASEHVRLAVVMERLDKPLWRPAHIPEVDVRDVATK